VTVLRALAPGKVNLCLFLGRPRADGLHPLVSVVAPVTLADVLTLRPGRGERDEVHCPGVPGENLAARALAVYRDHTGYDGPPVRIEIDKRVPVAAGMGGGSGDAAAALRLIAHAARQPSDPALFALAPGLGADVPSQIVPRRSLMTGAGEHVEILGDGPPIGLLIVPSGERLSTPDVFREADRLGLPRSDEELAQREQEVRAALSAAGGALPLELAVNDLEPAARSLCPSIDAALASLLAAGAARALVSGSGPTVFGIFETPEAARAAQPHVPRSISAEPVTAAAAATLGP